MKQPFDLAGRVAVVTGAGSGIGRATAILFAELGAKVVATDVNLSTVEETVAAVATGTAVALRHDVTSEADWAEVFAHVSGQIGRLDILVNNAGVMVPVLSKARRSNIFGGNRKSMLKASSSVCREQSP
jgi:NAD(P)-dependent dehydrogenase (short-subunit alcohol dehydrogenase family)